MNIGIIARAILAAIASALVCALAASTSYAQTTIMELRGVGDSLVLKPSGKVTIGLGGHLAVIVKTDDGKPIDPSKATLLLNGRAIPGLKDTIFLEKEKALIFRLVRTPENADAWRPILASPTLGSRPVVVSVSLEKPGEKPQDKPTTVVISATPEASFDIVLFTGWWLFFGALALAFVVSVVWIGAAKTGMLKDRRLPQIAPHQQTYSLGRSQMAFWFTLVFGSYLFLYVLLGDPNTMTSQALMLMGISGATALFASVVDKAKDTDPIGIANAELRAKGINSYEDVPALNAADRKFWEEKTKPFLTKGWYLDLTTDASGAALHRLQVVVWTVLLGFIFVVDVYRTLKMPEFSDVLLALMAVTSAGYVGFKYPEKQ